MSGGRSSGGGLGIVALFILFAVGFNWLKDYWPYFLGAVVLLFLLIVIGKKKEAKKPIVYLGNRSTKTYHLRTCPTLSKIGEGHMIGFHSAEEAQKQGYRRCNICQPH